MSDKPTKPIDVTTNDTPDGDREFLNIGVGGLSGRVTAPENPYATKADLLELRRDMHNGDMRLSIIIAFVALAVLLSMILEIMR